jgi:hypothetical protein
MAACIEIRLWRCLKRGFNYRATTGNKRPGVPIDAVRNWFKTHHIIGGYIPRISTLEMLVWIQSKPASFFMPEGGFSLVNAEFRGG